MEYVAQCGDIFLCDSSRTGAKIVKFLMQSPTIWHQIWRAMRGTLEPVRYYHAGMILGKQLIEQQWKVQLADAKKIMNRKVIIYRYKNLNGYGQQMLYSNSMNDIGKTYDIPLLIGKTLTWVTGLRLFTRILGALSKENEICPTIIGDWFWIFCHFGVKTKHELTTKIIDEYCLNHPKEWEIVYEK